MNLSQLFRPCHVWKATPVLFGLLLAGCAAQLTYREGVELAAQDDLPAALRKYDEALKLEPNNGEFRIAQYRLRERMLRQRLDRAEAAFSAGSTVEAEEAYRAALVLEPGNVRAQSGLAALVRQKRHEELLKEANESWGRKAPNEALAKLKTVLAEDPQSAKALALKLTIENATAKPIPETQLVAGLRRPLTIEFKDTPIRQVFEVFSRTSGLNFVFDKDVRTDQRTTVYLRDSTVENAINLVLLTNQLERRVLDGSSVLIYPNTPAKVREYQPLIVKTFFLANADVKQAGATLRTIVKTRDLVIDEKQNMIIMRDTPEAVRMAERLLAMHDLPEPEVMLEVEVLEVKRTKLLELGIRWPSSLTLTPLPAAAGGVLSLRDLRNLNSAGFGAAIDPISITARKQDSDANILANPRIRSRNREKARILVGERVPNITTTSTATGFVSESVQYVDVGLKLEVEPTIYLDNEVAIKISLEVSNIVNQVQTRSGSLAYQIGTRTAVTVLRLKDGENQILAGLINDEDRAAGNRTPGLGDIPLLGRLFGSQRDESQKTEIVLSITPRLIRNIQRPSLAASEFDGGTEASLRNRGGDSAPVPGIGTPIRPGLPSQVPLIAPAPSTLTPPPGAPASPGSGAPAPSAEPPNPSVTTASGGTAGTTIGGNRSATTSTLQGPGSAKVGTSFTVALNLEPDQPIMSVPLSMNFDPKLFEITGVQEGEFMRQGGVASNFSSRVDRATGQVFATVTRSGGIGASAPGTLLTLSVRALSAGSGNFSVLTLAPIGLAGRTVVAPIPSPQSVTVSP